MKTIVINPPMPLPGPQEPVGPVGPVFPAAPSMIMIPPTSSYVIPRPPVIISSPASSPRFPHDSFGGLPELISVPLPTIQLPNIQLTPYISTATPMVFQESKSKVRRVVIRSPSRDLTITKSLPPRPVYSYAPAVESLDGIVRLPYKRSIVNPVERSQLRINTDPSALALAYNPKQNILAVLAEIDEAFLDSKRSSDGKSYTLNELKSFAKRLGLKSSVPKEKLVADIKQLINDYRSDLAKKS